MILILRYHEWFMVPLMKSSLLIIIMRAQSNLSATQSRFLSSPTCFRTCNKTRCKTGTSAVTTTTITPTSLILIPGNLDSKKRIDLIKKPNSDVRIRGTPTLKFLLDKESKDIVLKNILVKRPLLQTTTKIVTKTTMIMIIHDQEWNMVPRTKPFLITTKLISHSKLSESQIRILSRSPYLLKQIQTSSTICKDATPFTADTVMLNLILRSCDYMYSPNIRVKQPRLQNTIKILMRTTIILIIHDRERNMVPRTKSPIMTKLLITNLSASQCRILLRPPYLRSRIEALPTTGKASPTIYADAIILAFNFGFFDNMYNLNTD